jgi:hypothetical protein
MHQVRHFEEEPGEDRQPCLLSKDEARRIAVNIGKIEFLHRAIVKSRREGF